jgi:phytoene dehydrogenase-like protein
MNDADVVIVGAGLTGLRAAIEVSRAGLSVLVLEKGDEVGGRMRTTLLDGCLLDHGFQVLLSGYPELSSLPGLHSIAPKPFWAGARIRVGDMSCDFLDPRSHPRALWGALSSPVVSTADLLRLVRFVQLTNPRELRPAGHSTADALDRAGFSQLFKQAFLRPFLRGVLLDPALSADAGLARFYLRIFARGRAVLPAQGVAAFPKLLADTLGREHIVLNAEVAHLKADRVVLHSGEEIRARRVICAIDSLNAAALGSPDQTAPHLGTATVYFQAERAPYREPLLTLSGDGRGPINNLAIPSNVQPTYAPKGTALISASVLGDDARRPEQDLVALCRAQLHDWFGADVAEWKHLQTFYIPHALPARPRLGLGFIEKDGIIFAGDYLSYGSQNGALAAGRAAAQEVLL